MIRSMTAFSRQEARGSWGTLTWELRSVNHRYLEIHPRLPEDLRGLESGLRERIGRHLKRGKVDCNLRFRAGEAAIAQPELNQDHLQRLLAVCNELEHIVGPSRTMSPLELLNWPGVLQENPQDLNPGTHAAMELLDAALEDMIATREREGAQIHAWISSRVDSLEQRVDDARRLLPEIRQKLRDRLTARIAELQVEPDSGRLEQELVYMAQKIDVDEELDRLQGHLKEIRRVLERDEPVGRRLDFLMQELNREANTLGSKSADEETTRISVECKVLIEQMREQIQNVE